MKKYIMLFLSMLLIAALLISCQKTKTNDEALNPELRQDTTSEEEIIDITDVSSIELPSDFSFSIVWNVYGISSYNSQTGKLVKTRDATDVGKYTDYVQLSDDALKLIYKYLFIDIDITNYPDKYDPFYNPVNGFEFRSEPSQTIIITATANGITKTITCENIALSGPFDCPTEMGKAFITSADNVSALLMALPEWSAFPDYEFLYD